MKKDAQAQDKEVEVTIDSLPEVDQSIYPIIPELIIGQFIQIRQSSLENHEMEAVGSALLNAAINAGQWGPVNVKEFMIHVANIHPQQSQSIVNSVYKLAETDQLKILNFGVDKFLLPTPELAKTIQTANHREYKPNRALVTEPDQVTW